MLLNRSLFNRSLACDFFDRVCCRVPADIFDSRRRIKWAWHVTDVVIWRRYCLSSSSNRLWLFLLINLLSRVLERSYSFRNIIKVSQIDGIALRHCGLWSGSCLIFLNLRQFLLSLLSQVSSYHSVTWALIFEVTTVIVTAYMLRLTIEDVLWSVINQLCPRGQRLLLVFIKHWSYFVERLRLRSVTVISRWSSISSPFNDLLSILVLTDFGFKYGVQLWVILQQSNVCRPLCWRLAEPYLFVTTKSV